MGLHTGGINLLPVEFQSSLEMCVAPPLSGCETWKFTFQLSHKMELLHPI
jgi:hypothetical protein